MPQFYDSDATRDVQIRKELSRQLGKTTAFPEVVIYACRYGAFKKSPNGVERSCSVFPFSREMASSRLFLGVPLLESFHSP